MQLVIPCTQGPCQLPDDCVLPDTEWEASASNVPESTRVVIIRTGIVLARDGGVLARMLPIFELFAGRAIYMRAAGSTESGLRFAQQQLQSCSRVKLCDRDIDAAACSVAEACTAACVPP